MLYLFCGLGAFAAIGAVIGGFRRYSKVSVWGLSVALTLVALCIVSLLVDSTYEYYFYVVAGVCVGSFLIATSIFSGISKWLSSAREEKRKFNQLKVSDQIEEIDELMLDAVDKDDKGRYKALSKRRAKLMKVSTGAGGVVDVVLGAVSGAINGAVAAFALISAFLVVSEMLVGVLPPSAFNDFVNAAVSEDIWVWFGKKIALDTLLVCLLCGSFRVGFRAGISSFLCILVILGLVGGAGYGSYILASGEACSGLITSISDGLLSKLPEAVAQLRPQIAVWVLTAVFFIILLVVVIIIGIFLPRLVDKLRDNKAFMAVDGVLGAIVLLGVVFGLLMAVGGIMHAFSATADFDKLTSYTDASEFGNCLYNCNPLQSVFDSVVNFLKTGVYQ